MGLLTISELGGLGFEVYKDRTPLIPVQWQFWRGESAGEKAARHERERIQIQRNARLARASASSRRAHQRQLDRYNREILARIRRRARRLKRPEGIPAGFMRADARYRASLWQQEQAAKKELARKASAAMLASRARLRVEAEHRRATAAARYSRPVTGSAMAMRVRPPAPPPLAHMLASALVDKRPATQQYRAPTVTRGLVTSFGPTLGPAVSYASKLQ
jgi:hypothetical protein